MKALDPNILGRARAIITLIDDIFDCHRHLFAKGGRFSAPQQLDQAVVDSALAYLVSTQETTAPALGAWKLSPGGTGNVVLTASILYTITDYILTTSFDDPNLDDAIEKAATWLVDQKNPDPDDSWGTVSNTCTDVLVITPWAVSSGLRLWLDGTDPLNNGGSSVPTDNTALATWFDKSGYANNAARYGAPLYQQAIPEMNNLNALEFYGNGYYQFNSVIC